MIDLMLFRSFAGTTLHIFIACTTVLGGLTTAAVIMITQITRCGGGDGEHTGPVLIGSTVIVSELTSTVSTMDLTSIVSTTSLTLTILTIGLTISGTTSTSAGIGAGPVGTTSTSMAIGPGCLILSTAVRTGAISAMTTA